MWLLIDIRVDFDICRYVYISSYLQIIILLDFSITFLVDIFASTEKKRDLSTKNSLDSAS